MSQPAPGAEFKPYIPAEQNIPEFTPKAIILESRKFSDVDRIRTTTSRGPGLT